MQLGIEIEGFIKWSPGTWQYKYWDGRKLPLLNYGKRRLLLKIYPLIKTLSQSKDITVAFMNTISFLVFQSTYFIHDK